MGPLCASSQALEKDPDFFFISRRLAMGMGWAIWMEYAPASAAQCTLYQQLSVLQVRLHRDLQDLGSTRHEDEMEMWSAWDPYTVAR